MFIVAYYCCCLGTEASFRFPTSRLKQKRLEMTKKGNQEINLQQCFSDNTMIYSVTDVATPKFLYLQIVT